MCEKFVNAKRAAEHLEMTPRQVLEMSRRDELAGAYAYGRRRKRWRYLLSQLKPK
jgi:hypothetical protein